LISDSKYIVILTGAGVSTSAGIPDFRGPDGIWTMEQKEKKTKKRRKTQADKGKSTVESSAVVDQRISNSAKTDQPAVKNPTAEDSTVPPSDRESVLYNSTLKTSDSLKRKRAGIDAPLSFEAVKPSLTHKAITLLAKHEIVKFCITQNVDGLHLRSGLPRSKQAVLHGCVFTEKCEKCGIEYFRDFDLGGVSFKKTGRKCSDTPGCSGDLRDTILDWDDPLPEEDWKKAQEECSKSDLVLALGTSLRIEPAGTLPKLAKRFVIVNLQRTPFDMDATLVIRDRVDNIMVHILKSLGIGGWEEEVV